MYESERGEDPTNVPPFFYMGYKLVLHHFNLTLLFQFQFGQPGPLVAVQAAIHYRESPQPIRGCQVAHTTIPYYLMFNRHTVFEQQCSDQTGAYYVYTCCANNMYNVYEHQYIMYKVQRKVSTNSPCPPSEVKHVRWNDLCDTGDEDSNGIF